MKTTLLSLVAALLATSCFGPEIEPPGFLDGNLRGPCESFVTMFQETIRLEIRFEEERKIHGVFGNAMIINGKLQENSAMAIALGNPEYIFFADLVGNISDRENFHRTNLSVLLWEEEGDVFYEARAWNLNSVVGESVEVWDFQCSGDVSVDSVQ